MLIVTKFGRVPCYLWPDTMSITNNFDCRKKISKGYHIVDMSEKKTVVPPTPRYAIGNRGAFFKRPPLESVQGWIWDLIIIQNVPKEKKQNQKPRLSTIQVSQSIFKGRNGVKRQRVKLNLVNLNY